MTKLISILILALVLFGGWELFKYWETFQEQKQNEKAAQVSNPDQLPGLPYQLEPSLNAAEQQGPAALRKWLAAYSNVVQDPRKAWIELDYCTMIAREDPHEAKRIFATVKKRTNPSSPVWPRIQELSGAFD
jgi:hypothetical protein